MTSLMNTAAIQVGHSETRYLDYCSWNNTFWCEVAQPLKLPFLKQINIAEDPCNLCQIVTREPYKTLKVVGIWGEKGNK